MMPRSLKLIGPAQSQGKDNRNKFYIFFIFLSLLYWNPLSLYLFFANNLVYSFKLVHTFYWLCLLCGLTCIYLIARNKLSDRLKNLSLGLASTGILLGIVSSVNTMLDQGRNLRVPSEYRNNKTLGLIFPPNTRIYYETSEFGYVVETNKIGLRDKEINVEKKASYRILCIGDSWVYGWGVNIEAAVPRRLEMYLKQAGLNNIEIINVGQPGAYAALYKENLRNTVRFLKPDLVVVCLLQMDDLFQQHLHGSELRKHLKERSDKTSLAEKCKHAITNYLRFSTNNIVACIRGRKLQKAEIRSIWKSDNNTIIEGLDSLQKAHFQNIDDTVKHMFKHGDLNPGLLLLYTKYPHLISILNDPSNPITKTASFEMQNEISKMKQICVQNNCQLVLANLPYNQFTGHKVTRNSGDTLNPYLERNNRIDSIYRSFALLNSLPYIELTSHFRSLQNKTSYFYLYDGHPTAKGYDEIAKEMARQLLELRLSGLEK